MKEKTVQWSASASERHVTAIDGWELAVGYVSLVFSTSPFAPHIGPRGTVAHRRHTAHRTTHRSLPEELCCYAKDACRNLHLGLRERVLSATDPGPETLGWERHGPSDRGQCVVSPEKDKKTPHTLMDRCLLDPVVRFCPLAPEQGLLRF